MPQTSNYGIFKKIAENRELKELHVKHLMQSISSNNLLEYQPIIVNEKMEIIDGQHRLEACRRLQIPIFYEIKDIGSDDIITLNQSKLSWNYQDYLNYYCAKGYEEYIKLNDYIKKNNISLSFYSRKNISGSKTRQEYKEGKYIFYENLTTDEMIKTAKTTVETIYCESLIPAIKKRFIKTDTFLYAVLTLLEKGADSQKLIEKFKFNCDKAHPCNSIEKYILMLKNMYNYKNKNPLED